MITREVRRRLRFGGGFGSLLGSGRLGYGVGRVRVGLLAGRAGGAAFFGGRLAVALFQIGKDDGENEFLLTVFVPFHYDVLFVARHHAAQTELGVLNLGAGRECRFYGHIRNSL